jgi:thiosulfate dehydrogenase [quinone] large subunit
MNHRSVAYALLRVTLGVVFLFFGVGKFAGGVANFAGGMSERFSGKLPSVFVLPFAYALPFAEVILGTLILIGLGARIALTLSGLLLIGLTFGTVMLGDAPTVAHNLQYAFVNFVLLWFSESNAFSVDSLMRRKSLSPMDELASAHALRREREVIS